MSISSQNRTHTTQVMAITSGKGGVGKTNIAINLAMALAEQDKTVTLLDADFGLANIDVMLNLRPLRNLEHVIKGEAELKDIIIQGPSNIQIIPAASGVKMMSDLNPRQHLALVHAFDDLSEHTDILLIDTSAGISDSVVQFCNAAQEVLVVVCNEPASITDAYATIKILHQDFQVESLSNGSQYGEKTRPRGVSCISACLKVTQQYLEVNLQAFGLNSV